MLEALSFDLVIIAVSLEEVLGGSYYIMMSLRSMVEDKCRKDNGYDLLQSPGFSVEFMKASFCYLGDMLSAGGGNGLADTTPVKTDMKKFRELLPFSHPATPLAGPIVMCTCSIYAVGYAEPSVLAGQ